ncbi:ubiquitin carboxyl-terminal hydrolase 40 isoform X1 [Panthera tigris]|uniref:ubiquitin carboxyl-terminal hydrolase 40 isoform X1 n=2 Tax=Panthera tigris TaxID=9694 RepID=UPI001C6F6323|nr:ubiquitin carboxyl-terminal hydrolase 40 isoform X1 [Panthera tigris]XP_042851614.1 ubiquitin carboxyl-terminal hydrolase 40 isoform X1 [Panthera tigris]XP_042851615.1 ubiquitin carboxyl-terminal hydrolase 40 isoform X1 [Panthera tigris]XP_042851616.1 ubiquitin carboxyl-terminal hydrolase 40 isoform X1 [Panthera tigris]XP_042851617.1 ubiquitin carboxyl-terminal hydrolase 40 isoform X1 [Panthera tigris]XP_042851622.1 ubiquitin carboxyl-terminal hydrolase 40 isoform X1 [Panthera tigris]
MFGDLFEEDYSSVSNYQYGNEKKLKTKVLEPPAPREFTNLSGIRNQGGTCYLNSLLQTLHFTPEFREALFSLGPEELGSFEDKDKPDAKVRIIPLQLQRMFAQLLLLDQDAASTTDLTDSFGWTSDEEMRQHDVQELNRILFSALETSLVGTSGHDLINRLYHGTIVNQVVCKECKNVSEKQEDFLDLTVAVKNVSGLEDALWNMYVEEEVFDCDNLYHCGTCDRLVKAAKVKTDTCLLLGAPSALGSTKSAKLRKLPPFLTVSLLRFNFDFVKHERYKETSCYTFPLRINLKPFCEQSELDDLEYVYDLFSVIIHQGGCYGGHYHVYIKDVDHLGNWQFQEEKSKPDLQNKEEIDDDPLIILKAILLQEESNLIPVDQLGQKLLKKIGISWNKKYRKQYGPLRKFLQLHSQIFLLSADESTVSLLKNGSLQAESDFQKKDQHLFQMHTSESPGLNDRNSCPHWFDINDSKVQPIKEKDIEQQFQGKESAYMLFYRKSQLQRPPEARANPRYGVPGHLLNEMDAANIELQRKRAECDSANNSFELHLHLGPHYHFFNGALHPTVSQAESTWDFTFDKRKTLGDLRQSILQLLEFWEGDLVLSVAKLVPAGLHVYQMLDGDNLALCEMEIEDGEDIFVWNGVEVGGIHIPTGSDCEPVLINVLHLAASSQGEKCQQLVEAPHVFPSNAEVRAVLTALAMPVAVLFVGTTDSVGEENWVAIPEEDLKKTFREQGLGNGSSVLVQESKDDKSLLLRQGKWFTGASETSWLQVQNLCEVESEEKQVKISATVNTVVYEIRIKAIKELKLMKELAENSCLRPIGRNGKLLCPVPDSYTVKEAELKMGSSLGLCPGKAPTPSQLFLFFTVGSDVQPGTEMEIIVEETMSARDCLKLMLEKSGLPGDTWHLRKMDWCYEAGEHLCEEDASLKELTICSGDTLLLIEGKLPLPGFLKVPIWWYQPGGPSGHWKSHQDQVDGTPSPSGVWTATSTQGAPGDLYAEASLRHVGDLEISEEATLLELKSQAMTLSSSDFIIPSPAFLRAWTLESKRPGRLLRTNLQQLKEYKLGRKTEICLEPLQKEENLGPHDVVLRTQMRIPGKRAYAPHVDLVWDTACGWTAGSLRQRIAHFCSLPVEKIEIAKYFPEKFEWLPVSSWNQQITKRKKKKKQDNLQGAPYYLKDGDTVGIKNLLVEDDEDFSTVRDDLGKETQKQLALGKQKSQETLRVQSSDVFSGVKTPARPRAPEASLSIHVGSFR